jgi:hypothetical protein
MPIELAIEGGDKLRATAKALRDYGRGDLKKELYRGLQRAAKPLKEEAKATARRKLPRRGGLGATVAQTNLRTRTRPSGRNAGIRIVAEPNAVADPRAIDRGRVMHPVYGRRPYQLQLVPKGWFSEPMAEGAPHVREEMVKVIDEVARKVILVMR